MNPQFAAGAGYLGVYCYDGNAAFHSMQTNSSSSTGHAKHAPLIHVWFSPFACVEQLRISSTSWSSLLAALAPDTRQRPLNLIAGCCSLACLVLLPDATTRTNIDLISADQPLLLWLSSSVKIADLFSLVPSIFLAHLFWSPSLLTWKLSARRLEGL